MSGTTQNWLPWQRPLRNQKNGPDQENSRKYLPFGKKIMKIGAVVTEIALLIVKKKKKLTQVKYIARSAGLPSGLNYVYVHVLSHQPLHYFTHAPPEKFIV